ncbi:hypothetical protein WMY93_026646 [Mugilogobius chulae]|uniref:Mediator of DNA damage checkpoint protein 1 n=1 Tax=Mugilogobius chulae TaxID=88201 RepID=A0AAW0N2H9_9GOBI
MDATQMINDSILESDEEEKEEQENDALGKLCILKNPHVPEKECPLYLGDNILGRDANTCSVAFLAPSVSKQHATISLSVYRRKGCKDQVEALLWDMGSMNGTRKGHIKLTPNVRYALSEGDSLVVADIPCKYIQSTTDVQVQRTPITPNLKTRDVLRENGGNLNSNKATSPATFIKKDALAAAKGPQETPAKTGTLSFEQTPTQPQSSLVPDSESESEEDKTGAADRRRKNIVSDSDSYKSSPRCSTFMSPTNKVVPESEDESPITPSSSYKNRTRRVSFNTEESDSDLTRQEQKKTVALDIVDDSEDETGNETTSMDKNSAKVESSANAVPEFNMDSDTDVEEEQELIVATVTSSDAQTTKQAEFHMDSDTDVEDNDNNEAKISDQSKGFSVDAKAELENEKLTDAAASETSMNVQVSSNAAAEFNMDSDTDVEEENLLSAVKPVEPQTGSVEMPKTSANPSNFNLDSDTDVDEEDTATPSRLNAKSPTEASKPPEDLEILSNSDTDVEGDSPDVEPAAAEVQREGVGVVGTGVNKAIVSSSTEEKVAAESEGSDTDVEDNEAEIKETEENEIPVLQREITPSLQGGALLKNPNCSTPIQQEGNMEELETQPFLSPSISAYRRAVASVRTGPLSSCSSQEDDYVVAETQSFILNDRAQDPNISIESDTSANEKDVSSTGNFQLELSDSSTLQSQAQTWAMESTQAFINANLEETQAYADAVITEEKNTPVDIALQATQAYINMQNSEEDEDCAEGGQEEEEEATQPLEFLSVAPTQPMCADEESDDEPPAPVLKKKQAKRIEEEETQRFPSETIAPTQPMEIQDDSETDQDADFSEKKSEKIDERMQATLDFTVAHTVQMEIRDDSETNEDCADLGKKTTKESEETQHNSELDAAETLPMEIPEIPNLTISEEDTQQNTDLIIAETVLMAMPEDRETDDNCPVFAERTTNQVQSDEEATQPLENPKDEESDDENSGPMFRKKKIKPIDRIEDTQPSLESEITVTPMSATGEDTILVERERTKRIQKQEVNSELTVAPTQPVALSDNVETDDEDVIGAPRRRKARKLEDTQSLNSQVDIEDAKDGGEASSVSVRSRRGGTRLAKEKQKDEAEEAEAPKRQTRGKTKTTQVSKGRRRKANMEPEDESGDEEVNKMAAKLQKEKEEKEMLEKRERENAEILEKERIEQEEMAAKIQKEKEEKEQMERQKREKEEKEMLEKKAKEEAERLEKERLEQEEMAAKIQKEKEEKEQMERQKREKEEKEMLEKKAKEEAERLEKERLEQEEMAAKIQKKKEEKERLEKAKIEQEKRKLAVKLQKEKEEREERERQEKIENERLEKERIKQEKREQAAKLQKKKRRRSKKRRWKKRNWNKEKLEAAKRQKEEQEEKERLKKENKEEQTPRRGRKTGRRTIAVPETSSAVADEDDVPAKRTRSRSNSSNSVSSERSASSNVSQSRGRGRGRGAGKTEVQVEKTPARGRRKTVAATEISAPSPSRTLSRSNSNTSIHSEFSASSVSSQSRGRGGRGRGRKTETESAKEQELASKATQRGRKSTRICPDAEEEKGGYIQPSVSTRGKHEAKDRSSKSAAKEEEKEESVSSSTERKGVKAKQVEEKKDLERKTQEVEENDEDNNANSSGKRKAAAGRNTPARKSTKATQDNMKNDKPKGRASSVQTQNSESQGDSGSSANNSMEREQPPQTPRSRVSRKRSSADSDSDPLAKTPRSSTASPSTGRSRAASQAYKVLFTGVVDEEGEKVLTRLGGAIAKDVADMNCLVTDKVRRTVKFLCAVAKGIPIVTTQWLEKSGKAGTLLSPTAYLVKDREQENKFDFNLQESLRVASSQPLLQGYEIHVTKSVKPEPVHMKDIISCSGAVFLPKMPSSNKPNTVVISCEEDRSLCAAALSRGLPVVTSEFILTGILQQKLDLETHKLSGPASEQTTAGGRGRGRKKT